MKMPASKRAKQFMPFAAVTGLSEALREKEKEFYGYGKRDEKTKKNGDGIDGISFE